MESGSTEKVKKPNRWQRLPTWAKWTIGVVGAIFLMGIGGAIAESENKEASLKDEIASLQSDARRAEAHASGAEAETQKIERELDSLTEEAKAKAKKIVEAAKKDAGSIEASTSDAQQELENVEGEVETVEGELSATESELGGAEESVAKGTITDGTWRLEEDYLSGTYEAPGGGSCYWAMLSSVGGGGIEDIIENGGFNKHQILTIESPYFESSGCGTWTRVE